MRTRVDRNDSSFLHKAVVRIAFKGKRPLELEVRVIWGIEQGCKVFWDVFGGKKPAKTYLVNHHSLRPVINPIWRPVVK